MTALDDKVTIKIEVGTLAVLISGMYISSNGVPIEAIPASLFIEIAEQMVNHLQNWDYDKLSLEEWVANCLLIAPRVLFSEEELSKYQKENMFFMERKNGNVVLVATAIGDGDV